MASAAGGMEVQSRSAKSAERRDEVETPSEARKCKVVGSLIYEALRVPI